jgi:cell division protein FtsN
MARDYAKSPSRKGASARRAEPARGRAPAPRATPGWIWLILGLSIGLFVAAFVYISKPGKGSLTPPTPTASTAPTTPARTPIPLPPKQPSRFSFYEMLPSYEVEIPREDAAAATRSGKAVTPDIAAPGQYLIQVGSYRTRDEAEKGRANLALLGVESRIEQVTIDQKDTWFRVRIGPESSLQHAQETMERLENNGIKGMLVKVKS